MDTLTFVGMTGSLRRASRNKGLLRCHLAPAGRRAHGNRGYFRPALL